MAANLIEFTRATDPLDADFHRLRGDQVLDKLLRRYPDYAENLRRAHDCLKDEPNYAAAMHRTAQSMHEGCIRVFVSYRAGVDADAARAIADVFRDLSSGKAIVTLADEFPARISGQDYKSEIESSIKAAHWFVFLVSEAREPSAWCMYETGMFRAGVTSRRMERLICIHHPAAMLPHVISEFQAVTATIGSLQPFLDGLFRRVDPLPGWDALNPTLGGDLVLAAAERIEKAFRPPRKPVSFNCRVVLEVRSPSRLASWADLAPCAIETDRLTADLFGKLEPPATWGELIANVRGSSNSPGWLDELHAVIVKASSGNVFRPISSTFECAQGGRVLRPVLHAMEFDGVGDEYRFHLYFLEDISSLQVHGVPERTLALLSAVRMHNRVRWEVLHRFAEVEWTRPRIEACVKAFSRIAREARTLGSSDVEQLCENYGEDAKSEVRALVRRWQALNDPRTGELTLALARRDVAAVEDGLSECGELNRRFFRLTLPVLEEVNSASA